MEKKKHPGGRPKVGLNTLPEGWQDHIIALYSEGASDVEIRAWIATQKNSCDYKLWDRWIEEEPEFGETIKRGRLLSQQWWEKIARENLMFHPKATQINATLWYMNMKNRFGWADTQKVEHSGNADKPIVIDAGPNPYLKR